MENCVYTALHPIDTLDSSIRRRWRSYRRDTANLECYRGVLHVRRERNRWHRESLRDARPADWSSRRVDRVAQRRPFPPVSDDRLLAPVHVTSERREIRPLILTTMRRVVRALTGSTTRERSTAQCPRFVRFGDRHGERG